MAKDDKTLYRCDKSAKFVNIALLLAGQSERVKSLKNSDFNRTIIDSFFNSKSKKQLELKTNTLGDKGREAVQTAVYCFQTEI